MQLGIIGAGNVGRALAAGWLKTVNRPAAAMPAWQTPPDAPTSSCWRPPGRRWDALAAAGDLSGKVVTDCTNPLRMGSDGLELEIGHTTSGGERVAALAPGASVLKTLNQTGFENMPSAGRFTPPAVMYVAGDDDARKPLVPSLVSELGFQAVDAGPLRTAHLLEPMAMLWIDMALVRGGPRSQAFALTQRAEG